MKLRYSGRTHVGQRREVNQDSFGPAELGPDRPAGQLVVLCDGMGGHAYGEVASALGVQTILDTFYDDETRPPEEALRAAFEAANYAIYSQGRGNMGTTGVAALLSDRGLIVANVGDSRAYLVRGGQLSQISRDHSLVAEQVQAGLLTPEQARVSNIKNFITRALGHQPDVQVDLFHFRVQPGDIVILSSDGMHGLVDDSEILERVTLLQPEQATEALIALANERGGTDNITVLIARVERVDAGDAQQAPAAVDAEATTEPLSSLTVELPGGDDLATPEAAIPAPSPTAATPVERPLGRAGIALSLLMLALLVSVGAFALLNPAPAAAPAPFATAAATAATAAPTGTARTAATPTRTP
jgi:serine/threonine protein phosphatase PrpC